jgi:thioredoxin-like negative regulator of GroEL
MSSYEPVLESIADRFDGQLAIVKVDIDAQPDLASRYQIQSIPSMLLFRHGELVEFVVGGRSEAELTAILQPHLLAAPAVE